MKKVCSLSRRWVAGRRDGLRLLFVAFSIWFVVTTLIARPESSIAGIGIMAAGVPIYYFWRRKETARS